MDLSLARVFLLDRTLFLFRKNTNKFLPETKRNDGEEPSSFDVLSVTPPCHVVVRSVFVNSTTCWGCCGSEEAIVWQTAIVGEVGEMEAPSKVIIVTVTVSFLLHFTSL